jgi:hypothetical protein
LAGACNATIEDMNGPVLVVEEARVPGENHRPWASNWLILSLAAASRVHPFCNLQSRARTHAVLVIGLYEYCQARGISSHMTIVLETGMPT